jgi:hypothetical protein
MRDRTLGLALLLISAGCSQSDLLPVAGVVTLDGQAVEEGHITFFPESPTVAPNAGKIAGGKYHLLSKPGKMRVSIQAYRNTGKRDDEGFIVSESYIPRRYNKQSELTVEVTQDGENHFDFNLTN